MKIKKKLLIIMGGKNPGHARDSACLTKLLKGFLIDIIELPRFSSNSAGQYDVIIVFTSLESAMRDQLDALAEFLNLKNKYLILLHEACIYERHYSRFREVAGVRFQRHNKYSKFTVYCQPHRLTAGLGSKFGVEDELYFFDPLSKLSADDEIFLYDQNGQMIGFERRFLNNNSNMIFISLGHDNKTLTNPRFQMIIKNINKLQSTNELKKAPLKASEKNNQPTGQSYLEMLIPKYVLRKEYFGGLIYSIQKGQTVGFLNQAQYNKAVDYCRKKKFDMLSEVISVNIIDQADIQIIENPRIYQNELSAPIITYLHITEKCNLGCKHCMFPKKGNGSSDLKTDEIINIIDQLVELGCYNLRITGGEPFVRPDIFKIIDYAKTKGMYIEVNTNGTFGKDVLNKISESSINRIIFSIDGDQEMHDKIRGQGNYQRTVTNIKNLKKNKRNKMELRINATLAKTLWNRFDNFINNLKIFDVEININILRPYGRAENMKDEMLSTKEFMNYAKTIATNEKYKKIRLRNTNFDLYGYHEHSYKGNNPSPFDRSTCAAASYGMGILPNGDGNLCGYLASEPELKVPNIKDVGVLGIWFSEPFRMTRSVKKEKCNKCKFYRKECIGFCHVMSYWETKEFGKKDHYCFKDIMENNKK